MQQRMPHLLFVKSDKKTEFFFIWPYLDCKEMNSLDVMKLTACIASALTCLTTYVCFVYFIYPLEKELCK